MSRRSRLEPARRAAIILAFAILAVATLRSEARAQLCGGAGLDGEVTVADGARILPAARHLVRDGEIPDADGRLALRTAAGLSIDAPCGAGSVSGTIRVSDTTSAAGE